MKDEYGFWVENHTNIDETIEKEIHTLRLGNKSVMFGETPDLDGSTGVWFAPKPEQSKLDDLKNKVSEGEEISLAEMGALLIIACDNLESWDAVIESMQRARNLLAKQLEGKK